MLRVLLRGERLRAGSGGGGLQNFCVRRFLYRGICTAGARSEGGERGGVKAVFEVGFRVAFKAEGHELIVICNQCRRNGADESRREGGQSGTRNSDG